MDSKSRYVRLDMILPRAGGCDGDQRNGVGAGRHGRSGAWNSWRAAKREPAQVRIIPQVPTNAISRALCRSIMR